MSLYAVPGIRILNNVIFEFLIFMMEYLTQF
jgi:hypothetical protein